jgi:hypothetical protein
MPLCNYEILWGGGGVLTGWVVAVYLYIFKAGEKETFVGSGVKREVG